jgi:negative regulator of flagellin synthesis FlgM
MQISDKEVQKLLRSHEDLVREIESIADGIDDPQFEIDPKVVAELAQKVIAMPDREDRIAQLKAEIEKGTYRPSAEQIVEAMIRRAIADRPR